MVLVIAGVSSGVGSALATGLESSSEAGSAAEVARWLGAPVVLEIAKGYAMGRTLMRYVHLHFGSKPDPARKFAPACARRW